MLSVKTASVHSVYCAHGDSGDDKRLGPIIGVFLQEADANAAQVGQGWYGGNGGVTERKAIILDRGTPDQRAFLLDSTFNDVIDLDGVQQKLQEQLKAAALRKLTDAEKKALGLLNP